MFPYETQFLFDKPNLIAFLYLGIISYTHDQKLQ